jgi:hypothetical protein
LCFIFIHFLPFLAGSTDFYNTAGKKNQAAKRFFDRTFFSVGILAAKVHQGARRGEGKEIFSY